MASRTARRKKRRANLKHKFSSKEHQEQQLMKEILTEFSYYTKSDVMNSEQWGTGMDFARSVRRARETKSQARTLKKHGKRAKLVKDDVSDIIAGRGRRKDLAGREKKRFYERERFKSAVSTLGLAGGIAVAPKVIKKISQMRYHDGGLKAGLAEALKGGGKKAKKFVMDKESRSKTIKKARGKVTETASDYGKMQKKKVKDQFGIEVSSREKLIELASQVREEWDLTPISKRTAKVHAPGGRKRNRRKKHFHEKKHVRERALLAIAALGTGSGILAGKALAKRAARKGTPVKVTKPVEKVATKKKPAAMKMKPTAKHKVSHTGSARPAGSGKRRATKITPKRRTSRPKNVESIHKYLA